MLIVSSFSGSDMIRKLLQTQLVDEDEDLAYEQVGVPNFGSIFQPIVINRWFQLR